MPKPHIAQSLGRLFVVWQTGLGRAFLVERGGSAPWQGTVVASGALPLSVVARLGRATVLYRTPPTRETWARSQ